MIYDLYLVVKHVKKLLEMPHFLQPKAFSVEVVTR